MVTGYTAALARFDAAAAREDWTPDRRRRWRALFAGWLRWQHDEFGTITISRARVVEAAAACLARSTNRSTITRQAGTASDCSTRPMMITFCRLEAQPALAA